MLRFSVGYACRIWGYFVSLYLVSSNGSGIQKKKSKSKSNKREEKNQNELIIKDIYWSMLIDSSSDGTANGSGGG